MEFLKLFLEFLQQLSCKMLARANAYLASIMQDVLQDSRWLMHNARILQDSRCSQASCKIGVGPRLGEYFLLFFYLRLYNLTNFAKLRTETEVIEKLP